MKLTDNFAEMERIGEQLLLEHADKYTDSMMAILWDSVNVHMPNASSDEKKKKFLRGIYDYWAFGNTMDEEFYYDFEHKNISEKLKYITQRRRLELIWHINDKRLEHICNNKYETYTLFKNYFLRDVIELTGDVNDFSQFEIFVKKHSSFVVKPSDMSCAIGVYRVDADKNTNIRKLYDDILKNNINNHKKTVSFVLEELIEQDASLACFHDKSVNGVRITTIRKGNVVHIVHPWIKIGANDTFVASCVLGGVDVGINPETGILNTNGYGELGEKYEVHPNSGIRFIGYKIPKWDEVIELAKKVAKEMPSGINYVGWDFVLTPKGWCIMEANFAGDSMWQLFLEKGMKEELEELIGWKSEKDFWWQ